MKAINAYIRADRAPQVLDALTAAGITHTTLTHVVAVGATSIAANAKMNIEFGRKAHPMIKLEIICLDRDETRTVELIRSAACTHQAGDGIIAVTNVNRLVKIRTAGESTEAL